MDETVANYHQMKATEQFLIVYYTAEFKYVEEPLVCVNSNKNY